MRLPRHPGPWFAVFFLWFATLWFLSSGTPTVPDALHFQASDKVLHFGYFFGGAGLLSAALFTLRPELKFITRVMICVAVVTLIGAIDEFHQSFIPGRSGNDPGDLAADFVGALTGSLLFQRFRHLFQ